MWNRLLHRLHLARELSLPDWLALLEAWWWLLVFHWRLRWVSFERLAQTTVPGDKNTGSCHYERSDREASPRSALAQHPGRVSGANGCKEAISSRISSAHRLNRLVSWTSHLHFLSMTCLVQSLALRRMLSRRSIASDLKIGAIKTPVGIHAHAWLEVDGEVIGDAGLGGNGFSTLGSIE